MDFFKFKYLFLYFKYFSNDIYINKYNFIYEKGAEQF